MDEPHRKNGPYIVKADVHRCASEPSASFGAPTDPPRVMPPPVPNSNIPQPPSPPQPPVATAAADDAPPDAAHKNQPNTSDVPASHASIMVQGKLYDRRHLLGRGAFGTCHLYEHEPTGNRVAIKTMSNLPQNFNELTIHRQMHHPNIVRMLHELQSKQRFYLIMEPCLRSLQDELAAMHPRPIASDRIRQLFAGAFAGLAHIHEQQFVHRDIKLGNLLLRDERTLLICDFGLAVPRDHSSQALCGTWSFLAPEVVTRNGTVQPALDVWAAGVCMYLCQNRAHPFAVATRKETSYRIRAGIFERPLAALQRPGGAGLLRLLERIFVVDAARRPTVEQVLNDEFFASSLETMMAVTGPEEQHFMSLKLRQKAAQLLHLFLGQKRPRISCNGGGDEHRLKNVHAMNFQPVWLCKYTCYDNRLPYRLRYNLSDGHLGVLYADETTIMRTADRNLHHFDLDGDFVQKTSKAQVDFFVAVSPELRDFYGPDWPAGETATPFTMCYATGYLRTAEVLVVALSNGSVQVNVLDRRYLFGQYATYEIVAGGESAQAKVVGHVQVVRGNLPWPVLDELTSIVNVLLKAED